MFILLFKISMTVKEWCAAMMELVMIFSMTTFVSVLRDIAEKIVPQVK